MGLPDSNRLRQPGPRCRQMALPGRPGAKAPTWRRGQDSNLQRDHPPRFSRPVAAPTGDPSVLADGAGIEPATIRLTVGRSTAELPAIVGGDIGPRPATRREAEFCRRHHAKPPPTLHRRHRRARLATRPRMYLPCLR